LTPGFPDPAFAIWHIDEAGAITQMRTTDLSISNRQTGSTTYYWGANRGDAGDLYPGSANNRKFGDLTIPDNWWYDYRNTGCSVRKISDTGLIMTADVSQSCICTGWSYDSLGTTSMALRHGYFDLRNDYHLLADGDS